MVKTGFQNMFVWFILFDPSYNNLVAQAGIIIFVLVKSKLRPKQNKPPK